MSCFFRPVHAVLLQLCDAPYDLVVRTETGTQEVKIGSRYVLRDGREARVLTWLNDYMQGGANGLIATLQRLEVRDDSAIDGSSKGFTNALDALGTVCSAVAYWVRDDVGAKAREEIAKLEQKHDEEKAVLERELETVRNKSTSEVSDAYGKVIELKKQLAAAKRLARQKRRGK